VTHDPDVPQIEPLQTEPAKMEPASGVMRVPPMITSSSIDGKPAVAALGRTPSHPSPAAYAPSTADFDAFYRDRRATIARALALSLGDADLAAEATDEAMTRAYERWDRIALLDRPEAWVYRVATNWAMSIFRRRRLSLHRFYELSTTDDGASSAGDPAVHLAVASLDVKHRSVVVCRHLLGWSVAETARALGISEGTVKSRLFRATSKLRTHLHDLNPSEDPR